MGYLPVEHFWILARMLSLDRRSKLEKTKALTGPFLGPSAPLETGCEVAAE